MVKRKSREERINEITQAAINVFLEKGYESTTMEAIAQKAGISKGGLYHHFQSKDMILIMANEKISAKIEKLLEDAGKFASVREGLLFYIENYLNYWLEHPKEIAFLFLSLGKILDNPELLKYYRQFTQDYMHFFEETFKKGIQCGEFEEHNVKVSAMMLVSAMDGILSYMLLDESLNLEDVVKNLEEKFITPIENHPC
ncbi:TetR/AcrR family transcriptional regulator [Methanobacterium petrolearium]|uniref:TetR/AcrR family transcriptional regulator n=1 Tax=Methanobacterium petrolearium TaxID=710190 RepID=UPI001AE6ECC3|nr:TetR/AcrR family transcriptional regulator [Methanobacterium petrolearium]MBP1945156.1 AcrR family transcriptional regulator [Methanobacterium petrolearium]BDZ71084.1 TetR family transcriptional regulator [Methanobacterium petrolearium]